MLPINEDNLTVQVLLGFAILTLALSMSLKLAAVLASTKSGQRLTDPVPYSRPVVSVLVPLFRESEIAGTLVARLKRLRYPKALLDVCLVVEEEDHTTHETLARTHLPGWMRVISVPQGSVQTKPRALNFALVFCRGSIVGIYDAEDAPEPDQIDKVVARFEACDPDVACLPRSIPYRLLRFLWKEWN